MTKLVFLGSGGGRYAMATQARATGGFRIEMDGVNIHVDPGPGALVRAKEYGVNVKDTDVVMVSHVHLDHSNDCNAMIDAMTEGAKNPKGMLVGSASAIKGYDNDSPAVLKIYLKALESVTVMKAGDSTNLKAITVKATPTRHTDPSCIGFRIEGSKTISYTSDTEYFPELKKFHKNADLLIINMLRPDSDTWPMHMNLDNSITLIKETNPKLCVLQHFGMKVIERGPEKQAQKAAKETGTSVIAAEDGMRMDLDKSNAPLGKFIKK
ncbi:MAG: MBL fold metallo-hydrolase [Candidatus Aenigmarchaeota archaeon]|nr:MBL fold metallo-hydrolase [Candidatus Aenigmarchaeota archaeon]